MMQWNEDVVDLEPNFVQVELLAHLSETADRSERDR
jgi:hypothetical protein